MKFTLEQTDFSKICQNPEIPLWYISPDTNERTVVFARRHGRVGQVRNGNGFDMCEEGEDS